MLGHYCVLKGTAGFYEWYTPRFGVCRIQTATTLGRAFHHHLAGVDVLPHVLPEMGARAEGLSRQLFG